MIHYYHGDSPTYEFTISSSETLNLVTFVSCAQTKSSLSDRGLFTQRTLIIYTMFPSNCIDLLASVKQEGIHFYNEIQMLGECYFNVYIMQNKDSGLSFYAWNDGILLRPAIARYSLLVIEDTPESWYGILNICNKMLILRKCQFAYFQIL